MANSRTIGRLAALPDFHFCVAHPEQGEFALLTQPRTHCSVSRNMVNILLEEVSCQFTRDLRDVIRFPSR
jgi:hypothetical protein